jgi:hypothetical protein
LKEAREIVSEAESRWYEPLCRHCRELFSGIFFPSHDHLHHARVWSHARSIFLRLCRAGVTFPENTAESLLVAVFFHDAGLARTSAEQHGRESRRLCEEYFRTHGLPASLKESWSGILHAVEHHDDKSPRPGRPVTGREDPPDLLLMLSAADDLDAFGCIGIYRYAEIYLMRDPAPEQLPRRVLENVRNRFQNLRTAFGVLEDFLADQERRYLQVYEFYLRLSQAYAAGTEKPSWEPALVSLIGESIRDRKNLLDQERELPSTGFDAEIGDWFGELDRELRSHEHSAESSKKSR